MANAIVLFEIMPESPETNLEEVKDKIEALVKETGSKGNCDSKIEPLAFGLKKLIFGAMYEISDDNDFDGTAEKMVDVEGVQSAKVLKVDLAMG